MEKRRFSRVQFQTRATVQGETSVVEGQVENLSLNGLLLNTPGALELGEKVQVQIFLTGDSSKLSFGLKGKVVRLQDSGLAIQFQMKGIDIDALTHLRYIVSYNRGDWDGVMKEYLDYLDADQEQ